jgi:hypothetical protein
MLNVLWVTVPVTPEPLSILVPAPFKKDAAPAPQHHQKSVGFLSFNYYYLGSATRWNSRSQVRTRENALYQYGTSEYPYGRRVRRLVITTKESAYRW